MAKILSRYRLPAATVAKIAKAQKILGVDSPAVAVERIVEIWDAARIATPAEINALAKRIYPHFPRNVVIKNVAKGPTITVSVGTEKTPFLKPDVIAEFVTPKSFARAFDHAQKKPDATLTLRVAPNRR